jgi:hypothetical protein
MATNPEGRQTSIRAVTSTTGTYNEDWMSYCGGSGTYNERLLAKINTYLSASHANLPEAWVALVRAKGANSTGTADEMGAFTAS